MTSGLQDPRVEWAAFAIIAHVTKMESVAREYSAICNASHSRLRLTFRRRIAIPKEKSQADAPGTFFLTTFDCYFKNLMSPAVKRVLVSSQEALSVLFLVLLFCAEAFAVTVVAIFIGVVLFRAIVLPFTKVLPAGA